MFSKLSYIVLAISAFLAFTSAHLAINDPLPIDYVIGANGDYIDPISSSDGICKGLQKSGPSITSSTPSWPVGSSQTFRIVGNDDTTNLRVAHGGGSCQASISYDEGETFQVLKSFIGSCPRNTTSDNPNYVTTPDYQTYAFPIPEDAPTGIALFSWTWFSRMTNEMYMNCAWVEVTDANNETATASSDAIATFQSSRPEMFTGFVDGLFDCSKSDVSNLMFPEPGSEIECGTDAIGGFSLPTGSSCAAASFDGGVVPCGIKISGYVASATAAATTAVGTAKGAATTSTAIAAVPTTLITSAVQAAPAEAVTSVATVEYNTQAAQDNVATTSVAAVEYSQTVQGNVVVVTLTETFVATTTLVVYETAPAAKKAKRNVHGPRY